MQFIDTHCHIHDSEFVTKFDQSKDVMLEEARAEGVTELICVGTDVKSSKEAVEFCVSKDFCRPTVALHPHEAEAYSSEDLKKHVAHLGAIIDEYQDVAAVGECGLDYFYHESDEIIQRQKDLLRRQIELAKQHDLPMIFHVRQAFDDFFAILDEYSGVRGVVHSFSSDVRNLQGCIDRGLYIGLNGIMTFTRDEQQLAAARAVPLEKLMLETDAPYLTPKPFRGKVCKPKHLVLTAQFLSELRGEDLEVIAAQTTVNARTLFAR